MKKQQLCLGLVKGMNIAPVQQLLYMKAAGFDGFFALWERPGQLDELAQEAAAFGLLFQSVHAPFRKTTDLWLPGSAGDAALQELLCCLADCKRLQVPIMVSHVYMGFDIQPPTDMGIARFRTLLKAADEVKIAFENVESEPHLQVLFEQLNGGFCWDSGHELCYNRGKDMLQRYGNRLIATHLNDNFGVSRADGCIDKIDDLHLLPFDGAADWDDIAARLDRHGFDGPLTFELSVKHENYNKMPPEQFFALAYRRACRVAAKRGNYGISSHQ